MALVTIFAIATIWMAVKRREFFLAVIAVITGLMLATTGTDIGKSITDTLTQVSKTIDGLFTKD
jgi:TctA family transporter